MKNGDYSTSSYFNASRSSMYDRKIRAGIPGYESLHEMVNLLMRAVLPRRAKVLVVGAGTGMELVTLGLANPEWTFTAVDPSDDMLSVCKTNVDRAGLSKRVVIVRGDLQALGSHTAFDAATSILVSHFIKDANIRATFFKTLAERIVDKGVLVTADIAADTSDQTFQTLVSAWKAHYAKAGIPPQEVEADCDRSLKTVSILPESAVVEMLARAGCGSVLQFYRGILFSGWLCFKTSGVSIAPNQAS